MEKNSAGSISFYITNVCNLNCENCFSLNNYALKGHSLWKDNEEHCKKWAEIFDPVLIFVLGGEPMVNPTFLDWVHGLAKFFPLAEIRVNTNGEVFHLYDDLYEQILPYKGRVNFSISNHNEHRKQAQIDWAYNFCKGKIEKYENEKVFQKWRWNKIYNDIKDPSWPEVWSVDDYNKLPAWIREEIETVFKINIMDYCVMDDENDFVSFIDENGIRVAVSSWDIFQQRAVKYDPNVGKMFLHDNDPKEACANCHGGICSIIADGKLYKCAEMRNIPLLLDQGFPLEISNDDEKLLRSYQPAEYTWDRKRIDDFVNTLNPQSPIPQCKFCSVVSDSKKIHATNKKLKIIKRVRH